MQENKKQQQPKLRQNEEKKQIFYIYVCLKQYCAVLIKYSFGYGEE